MHAAVVSETPQGAIYMHAVHVCTTDNCSRKLHSTVLTLIQASGL